MTKSKKEIMALSYDMIFQLFSKNKHVIFILDVEYNLIKDDSLAEQIFDRNIEDLYSNLFINAHNLYFIEFESYDLAYDFFHTHYFPKKYKEHKIVVYFYSNSQQQEANL